MMLGVVRTPQVIPLWDSFTNHGGLSNGCTVGSAPVLEIISILKARGENGECQSE